MATMMNIKKRLKGSVMSDSIQDHDFKVALVRIEYQLAELEVVTQNLKKQAAFLRKAVQGDGFCVYANKKVFSYKTKKAIAEKAGISAAFLTELTSGKKRPSWPTAKNLAAATGTSPVLWMDGGPGDIQNAIHACMSAQEVS